MNGDKAPGPDRFGAHFYKHNWDIVGPAVIKATRSFLESGKLLQEMNSTFLTLIPKVQCPQDVSEFRPIACCNTLYKGITKLLCSRLKEVLPNLISENQGAFVHSRYIVHNIMVCQDLVRKYGRKNSSPSCMIKLDLRKAYDTVEWNFIEEMMQALNFPKTFIDWIMTCVTTPKFSIVLNGSPHGYFRTKRGLRQGDPLSPLLFVLGMEYLSRIMAQLVEDPKFKLHPRCRGIKLTHMCFADDLIMCCKGEKESVDRLLKCFMIFSMTSGLKANSNKTEMYSCGMKKADEDQILAESGFRKGGLPFKYLGVPICSKMINARHCEILVEKMTAQIRIWSSRNISYAGRCQLINSVLLSIHQYWAQVFVLPSSVLHQIEQVCRAYLWSGQWNSHKPGYISWENVCKPKKEGGLGFRDIHSWNVATMGKHSWAIATKQDSLWLKWINSVYLKGRDWWSYEPPVDSSWYWKKICKVRDRILLDCQQDEIMRMRRYKVSEIYDKIVQHKPTWIWARNIWSRFNVPKHRFCAWLGVQRRLPTADRITRMGTGIEENCVLCEEARENHRHLFFECMYSKEVLEMIKQWLGDRMQQTQLERILRWVNRTRSRTNMHTITWNSAITALVYHVWKARNKARHGGDKPTAAHMFNEIKNSVKEKVRLKNTNKMSREQI
ncbi:LINE-1 retrotransposable element ORF2 protein [Bienertia sinuspersici]